MNDEEPLVIFKDNALPLFVDSNVRIACMSVFLWENFGTISYFPIIVQPSNFKNLYVSLCMGDKKDLKQFFEEKKLYQILFNDSKIIYEPIDKFDLLQYDENPENKNNITFLYLEKKNVDISNPNFSYSLAKISQQILNPLGIGVFYQESFKLLKSIKSKEDLSKNANYCQAPFSMEIIDRLFYNPRIHLLNALETDKDINIIDTISLMCLQYPLKPLITPINATDELRRRTIFSRITLINPPSIFLKSNLCEYKSGILIDPFTWVIVNLDKKAHKTTYAVIVKTDKIEETKYISLDIKEFSKNHYMNLEPWNIKANDVCVQFKAQKAAIISPYHGILKVYSEEHEIGWSAEIYKAQF